MKSLIVFLMLTILGVSKGFSQIPVDRQKLLNGEGMGLAAYAERNGFPGPKHVLELKDTLGLTPEQVVKTETLIEGVIASAKLVGEDVVDAEERLHSLFTVHGPVNRPEVQRVLDEIAGLRSSLRYLHLQAHLEMKNVLTAGQTALYSTIRGYGHHETK